jgi:uncharacterized protein (DUF2235 family)
MKRLIICCDGTWNKPDQMDRGVMRPTNVVKIARMVLPQAPDGTTQQVYYDKGVGTGDVVDKLFGGAFGVGLKHNVINAYDFLCRQYESGDEVWLFGFSRGAYTVRRVVGMVRKCGVLPKDLDEQSRKRLVQEAYEIFLRRENADQGGADSEAAIAFRERNHSPRIPVHFIGLWDTVGAYGIAGVVGQLSTSLFHSKARFHDRRLSSDVKFACHAIAIDERRRLFSPTLWEQTANGAKKGQVIEQRWFAGVHSNVGGGYENTGLSDITLHWMAARAEARGLYLDPRWREKIMPDEFGELRNSRTGIYRLMPGLLRTIGAQTNGFEQLHIKAFERMQRDPNPYTPENLLAYLQTPGHRIDFSEPV